MRVIRAKIDERGRLVIPAEYRRALGLRAGQQVILRLDDGAIQILPVDEALRRSQELVRQYVPEGDSLVDELMAERWAEAQGE